MRGGGLNVRCELWRNARDDPFAARVAGVLWGMFARCLLVADDDEDEFEEKKEVVAHFHGLYSH